jgi:hypothetical protein
MLVLASAEAGSRHTESGDLMQISAVFDFTSPVPKFARSVLT